MPDNPRIEDLRRRVQKDPASIAFAQLAEEYRRAGLLQEAVDACRAGLAIHPGYLSARVTLGRAFVELNQLEEAQAELEVVLKSAPENLAAIRGLAEIHHRRGNLTDALTQYRAALNLARNDPDLEETVNTLTRQLTQTKGPTPVDGLSFEQVRQELLTLPHAQPAVVLAEPRTPAASAQAETPPTTPTLRAPTPPPPLPPSAIAPDEVARSRAEETIGALEQWLEAIHVAGADRRP